LIDDPEILKELAGMLLVTSTLNRVARGSR
jgi:hypothetical protein